MATSLRTLRCLATNNPTGMTNQGTCRVCTSVFGGGACLLPAKQLIHPLLGTFTYHTCHFIHPQTPTAYAVQQQNALTKGMCASCRYSTNWPWWLVYFRRVERGLMGKHLCVLQGPFLQSADDWDGTTAANPLLTSNQSDQAVCGVKIISID